ncbi:WD40/YVTN/BNR-like repeat-containing protein [Pseudoduganella danionis]|uniref:Exo-alpha-sialidase n=1 Tax=Pseudoduganella danionis TaxID=1890295 RepID=A0ABW9SPY2_9BURK|nr:exo-alpha-sialidase [Pseudoduganella danionis]MTW34105.1 exo-alpha-sialidase [Pseudoduganella danionis]
MSDRAYLATRKGLFELHRTAVAWQLGECHFLGDPVSMLLADQRDGTLYAALHLGHFGPKLHRRRSGSEQWTEVAVPAFPVKPAESEDPVEWKVQQIWSLAAGGPDQPGVLWAGTLPGGLFRSDDYGESWQLVEALWQVPERAQWMGGGYDVPGIHSICVDPRDSNAVLVGISCGGVWLTTDGGASWQMRAEGMRATYMPPELAGVQAVQDPHRIVRCAAEPDKLWCQHHNGIWRSTDNGAHWQEVRPQQVSNFGFVTAVHPRDGETAWFVPASTDSQRIPPKAGLAVTHTRDGGQSFTAWRGGLPQQHCYDLVYRHGLDVSADGRVLLMGSTTGGVWLSEDGGGQWQTIAAHLPPVYAVSFG